MTRRNPLGKAGREALADIKEKFDILGQSSDTPNRKPSTKGKSRGVAAATPTQRIVSRRHAAPHSPQPKRNAT